MQKLHSCAQQYYFVCIYLILNTINIFYTSLWLFKDAHHTSLICSNVGQTAVFEDSGCVLYCIIKR